MAQVLHQVKSLRSYDACVKFCEANPAYKSHPHGEGARSIGATGKCYLSIRPDTTDEGYPCFAIRYHKTDVVIWWRTPMGDRVTVTHWQSQSTAAVADACTPFNLSFTMHLEDDNAYVRVALPTLKQDERFDMRGFPHSHQARCYAFARGEPITFVQNRDWCALDRANDYWSPIVGHPYMTTFIDGASKSLNNALRRTRYFDFCTWLDAVMSFDQKPVSYNTIPQKEYHLIHDADTALETHGVLGCLADSNYWPHLKNWINWAVSEHPMSVLARRDSIKRHLREVIYKHLDAVPVRQVAWYDWDQFESQRKLRKIYPWVL